MDLILPTPDDFHVHLRQDALLKVTAPLSAKTFGRVLVMPNTTPSIATGADALAYKAAIQTISPTLQPLMAIKLLNTTTAEQIYEAHTAGVIAAKLYPQGVTTNSDDGIEINDLEQGTARLAQVFSAMQDCGMILCVHSEYPGRFCLNREADFLPVVKDLISGFPELRIVIEHISTSRAAEFVWYGSTNIAATITVHHLKLTLDDVIGDKLRPHHFCKPIAKTPEDRKALWDAIRSGNPKFFLGTDSAPHAIRTKEGDFGCAGVFTAPVAMPLLASMFEEHGVLDRLASFTSRYGAEFYRLPVNTTELVLKRVLWKVPPWYGGNVVPLCANETLPWCQEGAC